MKAHVLYGVNDLRYEDVNKPVPKQGEVLLKVENVGICGSDIPRIYETGAHRHPLIPGHEFAGTICEAGAGVEEEFRKNSNLRNESINNDHDEHKKYNESKESVHVENPESKESEYAGNPESIIGRRVGVFPLIPCGECVPCRNRQYEMCRNYNYLGSRCDGGFAEYVCVPVKNLIELPDNVSFEDAAMLEPTAVGAHAMRRMFAEELSVGVSKNNDIIDIPGSDIHKGNKKDGNLRNKSIAVIGLGTIGLLLTMHLIGNGAEKIYVVGNKEFQREKALGLGIKPENYCDGNKENAGRWLLEKTAGMGMDAIFECVGKNETYAQAIEAAAPSGKVMLLGNPASDMRLDKNVYWKILRNQLQVFGTWNSSFTGDEDDDWHYVVDKLAKGEIHPSNLISHRLSLSELEKGLHIMKDKTEDYVKIMIKP